MGYAVSEGSFQAADESFVLCGGGEMIAIKKLYSRFQSGYLAIYKKRTEFVLDQIRTDGYNRPINLLILGARDDFVKRVVGKTKNSFSYYLVDKKSTCIQAENFHYISSDLNFKIPYEDKKFDFIIADQIIEHLVNPERFLEEIARIGKHGCRVVIGSENLAAWHNIMSLVLGYHPFSDHYSERRRVGNPLSIHHKKRLSDPLMRHCKVPTIRALSELMKLYKMDIDDIRGFGHMFPLGVHWDKSHSIQFVITAQLRKPTKKDGGFN